MNIHYIYMIEHFCVLITFYGCCKFEFALVFMGHKIFLSVFFYHLKT